MAANSGLLLICSLMAAAAGEDPPPCNTICLEVNMKKNDVKLKCDNLSDSSEGGIFHLHPHTLTYDNDSRCITRRSGNLSNCIVTRIHGNGKEVPITYRCRRASDMTTPGSWTPSTLDTAPVAAGTRHHVWVAVAIVFVFLLFFACLCSLRKKRDLHIAISTVLNTKGTPLEEPGS